MNKAEVLRRLKMAAQTLELEMRKRVARPKPELLPKQEWDELYVRVKKLAS